MKKRNQLYNTSKRTKTDEDWNAYRRIKNCVNSKIKIAHKNYFNRMFDNSFNGNLEVHQS